MDSVLFSFFIQFVYSIICCYCYFIKIFGFVLGYLKNPPIAEYNGYYRFMAILFALLLLYKYLSCSLYQFQQIRSLFPPNIIIRYYTSGIDLLTSQKYSKEGGTVKSFFKISFTFCTLGSFPKKKRDPRRFFSLRQKCLHFGG